jgi:hypothetical protein
MVEVTEHVMEISRREKN